MWGRSGVWSVIVYRLGCEEQQGEGGGGGVLGVGGAGENIGST